MLDSATLFDELPKSIPIEYEDHGDDLLSFIEKCRKKRIRTDVELRISEQSILVHSYVLAAYSEVFHEFLFPEFYCNRPPSKDEESILSYSKKDEDNILQILKWMYTGELHLHEQSVYPIMNLAKRLEIPKLVSKCKRIVQGDTVLPPLPSVQKRFTESSTQFALEDGENANSMNQEASTIIIVSPEHAQGMDGHSSEPRPLNSGEENGELPQVSSTTQIISLASSRRQQVGGNAQNAAAETEEMVLQDDDGSMLPLNDDSVLENERVELGQGVEDRFEAVPNGFKCKSCRQTFPSKEETLKHIKALHSHHFTCTVCQRPFTNQHNLRRHMMIKHSDEADKKFECDVCGKRYAIKQSLQYHMKKAHKSHDNDTNDDVNEEEMKRVEEDYTRQSARPEYGLEEALEELSRHEDPQEEQSIQYRNISSNLLPPAANTISAQAPSLLSDPLASYLNPVSTLAQTAPSIQMMASSLPAPMPFEVPVQHDHGEAAPTLTMLTPAPISQKTYQMYHLQNQCDFCKKIFNNSLDYQKHKKSCNKHKCKHCNRAFSQLGNLRRHVTILHSGDKPYKCSMCSKAYSIKQSLRYHMHHTHGIYESHPSQNSSHSNAMLGITQPPLMLPSSES
ncbi:Oidioi.mRNA.OKI2018_I69.XSR.g13444.t1.cds [Oikopleura dioica]|uniref:Oidioi.mRNA.OKI2018_I69.XSR.g13444.t1.cds n=1 Tax=Oikopleura dioica TaxID=34765 RepID=A0ABN7SDT9_OIKDI|nr:Oidioi.mRNA.OKI2018_I69.XSR.g13444.t1.cds [Oikopleura dioica]